MINKKMFIGACLLGVSLIFTACSSSSPAFPSQFHGTWVGTGDDPTSYRITGDEFSIKVDGGEYQSLQEFFDSIPEDEIKDYEIVQQPTFNDSDQSIVFAAGMKEEVMGEEMFSCLTTYLSKVENEDKLNEYDIPIISIDDSPLTSLAQCEVADFTETTSTKPSDEYTKETDDSGGDNSGGNAISITTPTWLRGEWQDSLQGDNVTCLKVTESKIELSTTNDNVACGSLTEISVKTNESEDETAAYSLTLNTYNKLNPNNNTCIFTSSVDPSNPAEPAVILVCPGHIPDATGTRTLIKKS